MPRISRMSTNQVRFAFFRVDSRLIISDLRFSAEICGKELYPAKNFSIRSQYFLDDHLRAEMAATRKGIQFHAGLISEFFN